MKGISIAAVAACTLSGCTAFVMPQAGFVSGVVALAAEETTSFSSMSSAKDARTRMPFLSSAHRTTSLAASASSSSSTADSSSTQHQYASYDKPIVLIGLSSSPQNNELQRLALSLSGALAGPAKIQGALEKLERSQGALLLGEDDDDDDDEEAAPTKPDQSKVAGISLSALGLDPEGPFLMDYQLIRELIVKKTLSLESGVIILDFNHAAFYDTEGYNAKEHEPDLVRGLASLAKQLYEDEGLLSVYVNVAPEDGDDGATMSEGAKERKSAIEKEVLIPFSDYELCIKNEGSAEESGWGDAEWELQRLVARALLPPPTVGGTATDNPDNNADLMMGLNTFFLSLSFPEVEMASPYLERMCADVDSMEYRVDLLQAAKDYLAKNGGSGGDDDEDASTTCEEGSGADPRFDILYQQQRLRAMCRPHAQRAPALPFGGSGIIDDALPIVYTVRTANQAGTWPDDEDGIAQMFDLLELGLRSGAEVLDVESAWDPALTDKLLSEAEKRYTSQILGSHHVVGTQVSPEEAVELYRQCRIQDRAHGAKVVLSITSNENDEDQLAYKAAIAASKLDSPEIPNIGLVLGEHGSYSRILNPRFTPVTHESLPAKAAPGQLTAAEIMAGRVLTKQIPTERYAILGHNIAYSVSPQMQGSAFVAVKLPHTYTRADVEKVEDFIEGPIWNDDDFGGCSVTIPHKQNIMEHLDVLTDAAKEIGSVNTVIVKKDKKGTRVLIGENTDWQGIYNPLKRRIGDDDGMKKEDGSTAYALILGGGGTARAAAYAASKLGLERIYFNRTPEKAMDLAKEFGGVVASNLDEDSDAKDSLGAILSQNGGNVKVVISTLPAAAKFELPEWLLANDLLPVIFDVNYKPYNTALLLQATAKGCDVVRGSEMLWEQGVKQFELWTGRAAPYGVMKRVVLENCLPGEEEKK